MVRRLAVVSVVVLAGCSGLRDAFTGHQDVVARAAGRELTVEQLASTIAPAKQVPMRREVVDRLAELWVDYQLLGQAMAGGDSLMDSATVLAANWPQVAQRLANHLHDTLIVARAALRPPQLDSAYNGSDYRFLSHLLVQVRQDTSEAVKAAKRRQIEGYLAQIRRGTEFALLASQYSDDPGSKANGGSLRLVGRGVTVRPFEDAAFALRPGQVSDVVETAFGYHIIWRPALDAVRDSFAALLRDVVVQRLDSAYLDSLTNKTDIRVRGSAPAIVRAAAQDMRGGKARSRVLATYAGGRLREKDFVRWLQAFPPQTVGMVAQAPDSTLIEFVRSIARNQMLLKGAEEHHVQLTRDDRDSIFATWRGQLSLMVNTIAISAESLAADTSAGDRAEKASQRIERYFTTITGTPGQRMFFDVPPFLADLLRERYAWSISPAGVDRALERARVLRGPETPPGAPLMTPAPIQPGRGGPPVGRGARPNPPPGGNR